MKRILILAGFSLLGACASTDSNPEVMEKSPDELKNEAIEDFIKVTELESTDRIRLNGQLQHEAITEDYIFARDNRNTYLIVFARRCYDIEGPNVEPDVRYDSRTLRSRFDTIRGCRIRDIYPITDGMAEEIEGLTEPYER